MNQIINLKLTEQKKMSKKNIVLVVHDLKGNGAERVVLTLADGFLEDGHTCNIVCFKGLRELPSSTQITPHVFPMKLFRSIPRNIRGFMVAPLFDMYIKFKFGKPDLILSNLLPVDRILSCSKLNNVYLTIHSTFSKEFELASKNRIKLAKIKKMLHGIYCNKPLICVSEGVKNDLKSVFDCSLIAQRIYNPVDINFIKHQSTIQKIKGLPKSFHLHVGKFNSAKRQDFLIKSYALSGIETPLILMGQGLLRQKCEELVIKLGISDRIIFWGFSSNPYPVMAKAKSLLVSSDFEGLSIVILEALCLNVPVISTDCESGPREILPSRNLVPVGNERAFSKAIIKIDQDPARFNCSLKKYFLIEYALSRYLSLI